MNDCLPDLSYRCSLSADLSAFLPLASLALQIIHMIGRKTYPELSSLEIEKLYNKKGMKAFMDIEEVPFDVSDIRKKPNESLDGVNLTRPKKGVKFEANDSLDGLNLARPDLWRKS
ncbi:hypothetical protein Tco_0861234 [Tanacetum coccineum]|uniref:Uncharacterized protein n=1 Tax=Tanacetum coccineum TaxID=301880 RepID=A0ABQ5BJE4_9ASTR